MRLTRRSLGVLLTSSTAFRSAYAYRKAAFVAPHKRRPKSLACRQMSSSEQTDNEVLKVALCQFPVTDEKSFNYETASTYVAMAAGKKADLVVLPEIWNSPYATAAFPDYAEDLTDSPSMAVLQELAAKHKVWLVGGSIPERVSDEEEIYNTSLVFNPDGELVLKHRKMHLFDIDVPGGITFFESDTLSPGNQVSYFSTPWGNLGLGICYDIRFAEYAMVLAQKHGCKLLIYPGAFNMTTGPAHWELLQRARALDNQCFVVTASPARVLEEDSISKKSYPHYTAWGHSSAVSPWGEVIATTDEKSGIVMADLNLSEVDRIRASIPIGKQRRTDIYALEEVKT